MMEELSRRLGILGYRRSRREPDCWRVTRVSAPAEDSAANRLNPASSRALRAWASRLRDRRRPSPYQICLAMHIAAATRR
jgi:hypothetical protein